MGVGLPPELPLDSPVAFATPTTMLTDAAMSAADAPAVRLRDSWRVFTSSMSSGASVIDSPLHVDSVFSPRRLTARIASVSDEGLDSVTSPWTALTLLPILLVTFALPRADSSTETGVVAASAAWFAGTY